MLEHLRKGCSVLISFRGIVGKGSSGLGKRYAV